MRIAVAGASGRTGTLCCRLLRSAGHTVERLSRSAGADLMEPDGLRERLSGVDAVIDVTNAPPSSEDETVRYFERTTTNLLDAAREAGVGHVILLSIAALGNTEGGPVHYAGKRRQESLVQRGTIPWTIVRATQFHDFAAESAGWTLSDGVALVTPLLLQPVDRRDVAKYLVETALSTPANEIREVTGPAPHDLVDMVRRTHERIGIDAQLIPTWHAVFGVELAGDVMLPSANATVLPTTFEDWLDDAAKNLAQEPE